VPPEIPLTMMFEVISTTCDVGASFRPSPQCHSLQTVTSLESHQCSRFCSFEHVVGNVFLCRTSGKTHICDSTCQERVQLDRYSSVCRLSKRVFANASVHDASSK
jgi:hypothetical protein